MLDNIISKVLPDLKAHGLASKPNEACGIILRVAEDIKYIPCKNLDTGENFILNPEDYVKAEDSGEVIMIAHTHVETTKTPSKVDIEGCNFSGLPWLIYSLQDKDYSLLLPEVLDENS